MTELASTELLSDDVWRQLDPHAGRLPRRQTAMLWLTIAAVAAVVAAGVVVWRGGYLVARVDTRHEATGFSWGASTGGPITIQFPISNDGRTAITVTSIGRSGPGLTLDAPAGLPLTLAPHTGEVVYLRYEVTDCAAIPAGAWPVPVVVRLWWGSQTVYVQPGPIDEDQPDGEFAYSGPDPYGHPWQRALADISCRTVK
jgi:hypothetical protein